MISRTKVSEKEMKLQFEAGYKKKSKHRNNYAAIKSCVSEEFPRVLSTFQFVTFEIGGAFPPIAQSSQPAPFSPEVNYL